MPATEPDKKDSAPILDLSSLPDNSKVQIHVGNDADVVQGRPVKDYSKRSMSAMISGLVGAAAGYIGTKVYVNQKMFEFKTEVFGKTADRITGRGGIGAGLVESGAALGSGTLAAGLGSGEIFMANATELAKSGKYGEFPKFIYKTLGGPQGEAMIALAGAAAVGTVAATIAYNMVKPEKKEKTNGDWANKVAEAEPATPIRGT